MFEVTNLSKNPLPLSDRSRLAPGKTGQLKILGQRERNYETRGWVSIREVKTAAAAKPAPAKAEPKKQQEESK
jgi:hypothetical protein